MVSQKGEGRHVAKRCLRGRERSEGASPGASPGAGAREGHVARHRKGEKEEFATMMLSVVDPKDVRTTMEMNTETKKDINDVKDMMKTLISNQEMYSQSQEVQSKMYQQMQASQEANLKQMQASQEATRKQRDQELELEKQKMKIQQQQFEEQQKFMQKQFDMQQRQMQKQFDMQQSQFEAQQQEKKLLQDQLAKDMKKRELKDKVERLMGQYTMKALKIHLSPLNIQKINTQKTKAGLKLVLHAHANILTANGYL